MTGMRFISGRPVRSAAVATSLEMLALVNRIADRAFALGLRVRSIRASHMRGSFSRYLTLRDRDGRDWLVRVSDHRRPRNYGHPPPHFDLVSHDGRSGYEQAANWLARIATGDIPWFALDAVRQPRKRRRK